MDDDPPESSSRSEETETRDAPTSFDFEDINPWAIVAGDRPSPWPRPTWPSATRVQPSAQVGAQAGDQGPCLYFGPAGQRCSRRALPGGFCAIHRPGAKAIVKSSTKPTKIIAAIIGMVGVLWPFLVDIIREIARWLHSH